jgi:hypothetical protein
MALKQASGLRASGERAGSRVACAVRLRVRRARFPVPRVGRQTIVLMRLTLALSMVRLISCMEQGTSHVPPVQRHVTRPAPEVPRDWMLDAPLRVERAEKCQPDAILSEKLYWNGESVTVTLRVHLDEGRQNVVVVGTTTTTPFGQELAEDARQCVTRTRFSAPPRDPYDFEVTVRFEPQHRDT